MKYVALALLCLLALLGCSSRPRSVTLRVMTYNIHHGEGTDGKIDLQRIAKLITDNKIDLVALQEVDRNTQRTGRRDMPAELARLTGMHSAFANNLSLEGGEYGNAILSRRQISSFTNHWLPKIIPGEQRGILIATIPLRIDVDLIFSSVHLDHRRDHADRIASVARILELIPAANRHLPVIVAGDFNARPGSEPYRRMTLEYADAWESIGNGDGFTIPAENPAARIDYVWHSGPIKPISGQVLKSNASDHLPVLIELRIQEPTH